MLTQSLRMTITEFQKGMHRFHDIDRDRNDRLSAEEFSSGLDAKTGTFATSCEVFRYFAPDGTMIHQQYFRFLAIVVVKPSEIAWQKGERAALTEYSEEAKSELLKLFIVFDGNSDGGITKAELKETWSGKLLPKLREEHMVIPLSRLMLTEYEYQFAQEEFGRFAGKDGKLSFLEFEKLGKEAAHSGVSRNRPLISYLSLLISPFITLALVGA